MDTATTSNAGRPLIFSGPDSFRLVFLIAIFTYVAIQIRHGTGLFTDFKVPDADDALRLTRVLDLVGGQAWYDPVEHRLLPPDGVVMHWSRLIDIPIAALYLLFSLVFDQQWALKLAAAAWPAIVFVVFLIIAGRTARTLYGTTGGCLAMLAAAGMPMISTSYFQIGRVDHHNVQITCGLAICAALILPGNPLALGLVAGGVGSLSLAVGLEFLPFVGLAGIILTVQYILDRPGAPSRLLGFGIGLGLVPPLLFMAQTGPQDWGVLRCDQLSGRLLALTTAALVFAIVASLMRPRLEKRKSRLAFCAISGAVLLAAMLPVISPCREGPYAAISDDVRGLLLGSITEAMPALRYAEHGLGAAIEALLPLYLTVALASFVLWRQSAAGAPREDRVALAVIIAFMTLGIGVGFYQIRAIVMGFAVMPFAFAAVIVWLLRSDWKGHPRIGSFATLAIAGLILFPAAITRTPLAMLLMPRTTGIAATVEIATSDADCMQPSLMKKLQALPPSLIMAPINLGSGIIFYSHHAAASAPYHRRLEAMLNGILPFARPSQEMAERVQKYHVGYVLVCTTQVYGPVQSMGTQLARGQLPPWLEEIDLNAAPLRVLKVLRDANGKLRG